MKRSIPCVTSGLLLVAVYGCSRNEALNDKLLDTYAKYVVLRMTPGDSSSAKGRLDSLLTSQGYTNETFFKELREIGADPERMRTFYDSVQARVSRIDSAKAR